MWQAAGRESVGEPLSRQTLGSHGLSVESGTSAGPDDGYYYVRLRGEVMGRFKAKSRALAKYAEIKATLPIERTPARIDAAGILRREMAAVSNKELLWTREDFARVERMTRGRPRHGGGRA